MGNPLPKVGTADYYTAFINAGILAGGNDGGWLGPYAGASALTIDPMYNGGIVMFKMNFSAAATMTITVTPSVTLMPGQRLRLLVNSGAYAVSLVLPSNFYTRRGVKFVPPKSCRSIIEFQYDEINDAWFEVLRSSVPATAPVAGGWQNLSLSSGWAALGGWQTPQYRIDGNGDVELRGLATTAAGVSANANVFSLPTGFLPTGNEAAAMNYYNGSGIAAGMLSLLTAGTAQTLTAVPAGGFVALNGIRYSIDS